MDKIKEKQEVDAELERVANGGCQKIADLYNQGMAAKEATANVEKLKG
jgi:hypothetical protein